MPRCGIRELAGKRRRGLRRTKNGSFTVEQMADHGHVKAAGAARFFWREDRQRPIESMSEAYRKSCPVESHTPSRELLQQRRGDRRRLSERKTEKLDRLRRSRRDRCRSGPLSAADGVNVRESSGDAFRAAPSGQGNHQIPCGSVMRGNVNAMSELAKDPRPACDSWSVSRQGADDERAGVIRPMF